jgi:hypothetical protein
MTTDGAGAVTPRPDLPPPDRELAEMAEVLAR